MKAMANRQRLLVGEGRTAEILAWGDGRVLRLYRSGATRPYVQRELRAFRSVHSAGVPSPVIYPADSADGLVEVDGRLGFAMEHVSGPTMLRQLTERPWMLWAFARRLADLHLTMHQQRAIALPDQRDRFHGVIDQLDLSPALAELLHETLDGLEDGDSICHGDFHPDNVILSAHGPVIIDWGPASAGAPAADVAWTVYLFKHGGVPPGMSFGQRVLLATLRRLFLSCYLSAYLRRASIQRRTLKKWAPIIAAIRLGDDIPEERDGLLETLRRFEATRARNRRYRGRGGSR